MPFRMMSWRAFSRVTSPRSRAYQERQAFAASARLVTEPFETPSLGRQSRCPHPPTPFPSQGEGGARAATFEPGSPSLRTGRGSGGEDILNAKIPNADGITRRSTAHCIRSVIEGRRALTMDRQQLLNRVETAWTALKESYAGLPDARLTASGVMGDWSVKEILAHVTTWEEEALEALPVIMAGGKTPRYIQYGGIDGFNARMSEQKRSLSLDHVLRQLDDTHQRLLAYLQSAPDEQLARETRFRHRLRLDTYSHYPLHARAIREWREQTGG